LDKEYEIALIHVNSLLKTYKYEREENSKASITDMLLWDLKNSFKENRVSEFAAVQVLMDKFKDDENTINFLIDYSKKFGNIDVQE
jgi:hypothetical protein